MAKQREIISDGCISFDFRCEFVGVIYSSVHLLTEQPSRPVPFYNTALAKSHLPTIYHVRFSGCNKYVDYGFCVIYTLKEEGWTRSLDQ